MAHIRVMVLMYSREWSEWVKHLPVIANLTMPSERVNGHNEPSCCTKKQNVNEEEISEAFAREQTK